MATPAFTVEGQTGFTSISFFGAWMLPPTRTGLLAGCGGVGGGPGNCCAETTGKSVSSAEFHPCFMTRESAFSVDASDARRPIEGVTARASGVAEHTTVMVSSSVPTGSVIIRWALVPSASGSAFETVANPGRLASRS